MICFWFAEKDSIWWRSDWSCNHAEGKKSVNSDGEQLGVKTGEYFFTFLASQVSRHPQRHKWGFCRLMSFSEIPLCRDDSNLLVTTEIQGNPQFNSRLSHYNFSHFWGTILWGLGFKLYFPKVRSSGCELWYHSHESPGRSVGEAMGDHEDMLFGHVTPNSRGSKGILLGMWRLGKWWWNSP